VIAALPVLPIPPAEKQHLREENTHVMDFRPILRARPAMAIYSMAGFGAGLIGPFVFGAALDLAGDTTTFGWGLAYTSAGLAALVAPLAMRFMGLRGDPET
jgi:MFS family permease